MRRVALALAAVVLVVRPAPVAADPSVPPGTVAYRPPVAGPVVDPFRPPPHPWDAGNRGVDYAAVAGGPVAAAADGEVVFAGQVAGSLHVVLLHADGIRTSYSFLQSVAVHRGDRVKQGQTVGTSGDRLHFGARVGDDYVDPANLFAGGPPEVHLVADDEHRPGTEGHERAGLLQSLVGLAERAAGATVDGVTWARDRAAAAPTEIAAPTAALAGAAGDGAVAAAKQARDAALAKLADELGELKAMLAYGHDLDRSALVLRELGSVADWYHQRGHCTPASVTPPPLSTRHIAVEVAGFGSSSGATAVDDVDTTALGYAPADVTRFSYAGGTIVDNAYNGRVSSQDIRVSGRRLRQLLERVGQEHPGVPIDVIAHSQGGIVAREALAQEGDAGDPSLPPISSLVMLGVPNQGADLATAANMVGSSTAGNLLESGWTALTPDQGDVTGPAIHQLAEASTLLARLNHTPLPPGVHVTSIGARTDPVVPGRRTRLAGAQNIVVDSGGALSTHSRLPRSPQALREVSLAVHGMSPTCQALADMMADETVSEAITIGEDALGAAAWYGGRWVDAQLPATRRPIHHEEAP